MVVCMGTLCLRGWLLCNDGLRRSKFCIELGSIIPDLAQAINEMPDNTPGTDGIRKGDLQVLSPSAIWLLTLLLQAIENQRAAFNQ